MIVVLEVSPCQISTVASAFRIPMDIGSRKKVPRNLIWTYLRIIEKPNTELTFLQIYCNFYSHEPFWQLGDEQMLSVSSVKVWAIAVASIITVIIVVVAYRHHQALMRGQKYLEISGYGKRLEAVRQEFLTLAESRKHPGEISDTRINEVLEKRDRIIERIESDLKSRHFDADVQIQSWWLHWYEEPKCPPPEILIWRQPKPNNSGGHN